MRLRWVFALLLLIPLADALFLVVVADSIGAPATVALVVLTGLVGMLLVRAEGRHTIRSLQEKLATGEVPTKELMDGGLLIAAGAFLLTPGLVTDTIGDRDLEVNRQGEIVWTAPVDRAYEAERLGKGESLDQVMGGMKQVAEGIWNAKAARDLAAEHNIEMPITEEVCRIVEEGKDPRQALKDLMAREPGSE